MRKQVIYLLLSLAVGLNSCSKNEGGSPGSEGAITLAIHSNVGDKQLLSTTIDQHITTKVMEQDLKIDQTIQMDMSMMTKEVRGDSVFVMEGTFDRWALKMNMDGAGMSNSAEFDTQDSTKNKGEMAAMMKDIFSKMIGLPFQMEILKNGKVKSTNMKDVMAKVMPAGATGSVSEESMNTVPFPEYPVKPGDTWKSQLERNFSGKTALVKADYKLEKVEGALATISFVADVTMKEDSKKIGTMNGSYSVETATGRLKDGEIKIGLDMEVDSPAGTKQQMKLDQTIKMTGKS